MKYWSSRIVPLPMWVLHPSLNRDRVILGKLLLVLLLMFELLFAAKEDGIVHAFSLRSRSTIRYHCQLFCAMWMIHSRILIHFSLPCCRHFLVVIPNTVTIIARTWWLVSGILLVALRVPVHSKTLRYLPVSCKVPAMVGCMNRLQRRLMLIVIPVNADSHTRRWN